MKKLAVGNMQLAKDVATAVSSDTRFVSEEKLLRDILRLRLQSFNQPINQSTNQPN